MLLESVAAPEPRNGKDLRWARRMATRLGSRREATLWQSGWFYVQMKPGICG